MLNKNVMERISCHNFVETNGYAYFSNWFYNGLFKVEILTGKTTFLGGFEGEDFLQGNIHWELLLKEGKIYFLPQFGRHLHIYKLADQSMEWVEIKSASEENFIIGEVVLGEDYFAFIPMEKDCPSRKMSLETFEVTIMSEGEILEGKSFFQYKKEVGFPASVFMKNYHIERADRASWKQMPDGSWYGFLPMGRQLLRYSEKAGELNTIPLTVGNEGELNEYLHKVGQSVLQSVLREGTMGLRMFLDEITRREAQEIHGLDDNHIGREIWKNVSEKGGG